MSTSRDDAVARLLSEAAGTMRAALDLAGARADRLETVTGLELAQLEASLKALSKEVVDRDHAKRDVLQLHSERLVKLETQRGVAATVGSGLLGGVITVIGGIAVWARTR